MFDDRDATEAADRWWTGRPHAACRVHGDGEAGRAQGLYWEFHDRLFAHQEQMGVDVLKAHACALGMDGGTFARCLDSSRYEPRVRAGMEAGQKLGIEATPTMFVNGRIVSGAQPVDVFAKVINEELDRAGPRR